MCVVPISFEIITGELFWDLTLRHKLRSHLKFNVSTVRVAMSVRAAMSQSRGHPNSKHDDSKD